MLIAVSSEMFGTKGRGIVAIPRQVDRKRGFGSVVAKLQTPLRFDAFQGNPLYHNLIDSFALQPVERLSEYGSGIVIEPAINSSDLMASNIGQPDSISTQQPCIGMAKNDPHAQLSRDRASVQSTGSA